MAFLSKTLEKLKGGLTKTREKINNSLKSVLTLGRRIDEDLLDELEEQLQKDAVTRPKPARRNQKQMLRATQKTL